MTVVEAVRGRRVLPPQQLVCHDHDRIGIPVGRLDLDTSGLLLLTNDTQFAERIMNPEFHVAKRYLVKANRLLSDQDLGRLRDGLELDDGPTRPAFVKRVRDSEKYTHFEITITEGRNRQVRRMVEALNSVVLKLVRVAIGPLGIGELIVGKWRYLEPAERARLMPQRSLARKASTRLT